MTTRDTNPRTRGLTSRLLLGQAIVLVAGALTTGLVAAVVGPPLFHDHLLQAGHAENSPELIHIEMAYRDASFLSLGLGLIISLAAAGAVSWLLAKRIRQPLTTLTWAARELSRGHYSTRVPDIGSNTELETLGEAFNHMAAQLEGVEATRRRMLADLAHELRTPIATVAAYHEALHDGVTKLGPESQHALAEQTQRLTRLANDIDAVSSAEERRLNLSLEPMRVSDLMWRAGENMRELYREANVNLAIEEQAAAGLTINVDRQRIGQVLDNLLTNALRHTPAGGIVVLTCARSDDEINLIVNDNGAGIAADHLPHLFERFYRADPSRSRSDHTGSGIGLTISKAITDAHGGTIRAQSPGEGQGSTFIVTLPLINN